MSSSSDRYRGRLHYDSGGTVHLRKTGNATAFTEHGERTTMLCGANLPGSGLPPNGMRLREEDERGNVCPGCLDSLRERGGTVPGFMRDGDLLNDRSLHTGKNREGGST